MITTKELEAFPALMLTRSITAAAGQLHRTQPQVSRLLKSLEEQMNVTLFVRHPQGLTPTEEAIRYFPEVEAALEQLHAVRRNAQRFSRTRERELRILATPHICDGLLPVAVQRYRETCPDATFVIRVDDGLRPLDFARGTDFDLALTLFAQADTVHDTERIATARCVVVFGPDHALGGSEQVAIEDLQGQDMICVRASTHARWLIDQQLSKLAQPPSSLIEVPSASVGIKFAARGMGFAITDALHGHLSSVTDLQVRPLEPPIPLEYWFVTPRRERADPRIERFKQVVRDLVQEILGSAAKRQPTDPTPLIP